MSISDFITPFVSKVSSGYFLQLLGDFDHWNDEGVEGSDEKAPHLKKQKVLTLMSGGVSHCLTV